MSEQAKLIIWSSVLAGLVLAIGGAQYYFLWHSRIFVVQNEIKQLEKKIDEMKEKKSKIQGLKEKKKELRQNERKYRRQLPSLEENTPSEFMEELHAISRKVNVEVSEYSPEGQQSPARRGGGSGYRSITMNIQATGKPYRLFRYIWAIEHQERLMRVKDFSLETSQKEVPVSQVRQEEEGAQEKEETEGEGEEEQETVKVSFGTMSLTITIYIYQPPQENSA